MMRELTLEEAKPIWDRFVPEKVVWTDDWDIRLAICKQYDYETLILYDGKNFFPLMLDADRGFYEIIGGDSVERNYLTFDPEFMKKTDEIPKDVYFDFLIGRFDGCLEGLCPQFFLDLTGIEGIDDFLARFSKKHRKNFRNDYKGFGGHEFRKEGSLEGIAAFSKVMFGEKSDFAQGDRGCYDILDKDPRTEYWSVVKDGNPALTTQYFFYGKTMSVCIWGVDERYGDTLKVALVEAIKLAKSRGCTRIDYAPTYSGWKFFYRLDTAPLWRYKRGNIPDSVDRAGYGVPEEERARLKAEGRL